MLYTIYKIQIIALFNQYQVKKIILLFKYIRREAISSFFGHPKIYPFEIKSFLHKPKKNKQTNKRRNKAF